jgi:hypothetical protein
MKNVADIDRQLEDLKRKRKQKFEENIKKSSLDIDALFEVDEEPPKKLRRRLHRRNQESQQILPKVKQSQKLQHHR